MDGRALKPAFAVEELRFPLVLISPTEHVRSEPALGLTYQRLDALLLRNSPFVVLLDIRGGFSTPARRSRLRTWGERNRPQIRRHLLAMGVVAESQVERGFVTAAMWVISPVFPVRVFTAPELAEHWLSDVYAHRHCDSLSAG